jgi:uncharacterized peroxidase-related enzyme
MAFIDTVPAAEAKGELLEFYRRQQGRLGYLPNYAKLYCHRPAVMDAWAVLQKELRRHLDDRSYSLITVAAARALGNSYCSLAHGRKLMKHGLAQEDLVNVLRGEDVESVTEAEEVMMRLAAKVARNAASVSEHDIEELKEHGFTDARVFDVVAAAAARCFFSRIPDALGARPDASLGEMDPELLELLCVGRPLSEESPESVDST